MAKNPCLFPAWTQTVHIMAREGGDVRVACSLCRAWQEVDTAALATRVGPEYSLINRRCRCRLTPGCRGWNRFSYLHGVYRPLWTEKRAELWFVAGDD